MSDPSPLPRSGQRIGMISLGCPKNLVDSEIMLGELRRQGHQIVNTVDEADTVIVNTCAFIDEAKQESIDTILEVAARRAEGKRLLVAGCMVNRYGPELEAEIPEIDGFVSLDQLREVGRLVQLGGLGGEERGAAPLPAPSHLVFDHTAPRMLTTHGHAYLKVAEGCNNPCTFCAIPSWRGRFRSRTIASLVEEARGLADQGISELCLLAQDTTRYGEDIDLGKHGLLRLVEALLAETAIPWIRFLYAYPTTLDEELLRLMGQERRFVSYVDMPLQHSHPDVLRAMRRGGGPDRYLRLLERARHHAPDIFLRSTFIVGFPGETEAHFDHLLEFVQRAELDHLGAFVYSPEPGTPSAELSGRVPKGTARRRHRQLLAAQQPIADARRRRLIGQIMEVLVEGPSEDSPLLLQGRHHGMAPEIDGRILINDGAAPAGRLVAVELTEMVGNELIGRIVGPPGVAGVELAATLGDDATGWR